MTNKKLQELIKEAKRTLKEYPEVDGFIVATQAEIWSTLSRKQQELVKQELSKEEVNACNRTTEPE